ncbi:MAG: DNA primase [Alphaproteobacteria bacterium]|nr:DNA primase [Alphaproteobacteria bacterium]
MAFPPGFLDQLRTRVSLAELVGRRVRLTRKGREHGGLCPFHNEKTPSFYVVEDKGFFHCFGCGAHGDAIGYLMRADNLDFVEAVERLAGEAGIPVPQQTPQEREKAQRQKTLLEGLAAAADFFEGQLWSPAGARARDYLTRRGLDEETIRRFRLGWAPDSRDTLRRTLSPDYPEPLLQEAGLQRVPEGGGSAYDYFRGRVMFPIGDRTGRIIAFGGRTMGDEQPKYLNSPDTPVFEKGRVLYGWAATRGNLGRHDPLAPGAPPVIVVEGYMDVIALHRAGFGTAVAPLGTALTETQLQELWRLSPEPTLCFDGDAAGQRAALRGLHRALPALKPGHSLRFITLPPGADPDSLVRTGGAEAFATLLATARPLSEVLWQAELSARPVDTPERRADLEQRLMNAAGEIAERSVQGEYRRFFGRRLFDLNRSSWASASSSAARGGGPRGNWRGKPAQPDRLPDFAPPRPPGRLHREVFLGMFLRYPAEIEAWVEDIAEVELPEPELDSLRRAILDIAHTESGLDANALRQHLVLRGQAEILSALAITVARHAGFATRGGDDPEVIRQGLRETLQLLNAMRPAAELEAARQAFAMDPTTDNLRRLTALKERELLDGPVGGLE